ncbi:MAG: ATP-binding cassette domain-containing protein [Treponema sp.]|jgi:ABC-type multidrug transport system ATPase subunit|nr:ATP-binding cassette domain-containing protein [Treponema sp.]
MEPLIRLNNVSFTGQNVRIIQKISLEIDEGKTTALVGASGCGKSTLLKLCAGLLLPTSGEVYYRGKSMSTMNRQQTMEFRRESAFVFQDSALWANQTLYQSLELPLKMHRPELSDEQRREHIQKVMSEVGYRRDLQIRPSALSMGEQKLIGFARAIMCSPTLLFLDEWTESLDDSAANRLVSLVKRRQVDNNTIVLISHNPGIIKSLAQIVIVIVGGYVYLKLTADQIREDADLAELVEKGIA